MNVNYWKGFNGAEMIIFVCHSSDGGDKIGVACICESVCFVKTRRTPAPNAPLTADWSNIHHLGEANTHPNFSTPFFIRLIPLPPPSPPQFDRSQ